MIQKVLYPGWDNLSFAEKSLVRRWLDSFIKFRAAGREIRASFSSEDQTSTSVDDLLINFQFDIVDASTTAEGISLDEIFPANLQGKDEIPCRAVCHLKCIGSPDPNCFNNCVQEKC